MEIVREIVTQALSERAKAGIKVRQPLNELQITVPKLRKEKDLLELIKKEVNVKNIVFGKKIKLDTRITEDLKEEGTLREVIRNIQEMRKEGGFNPRDKIVVFFIAQAELSDVLEKNKETLLREGGFEDFLPRGKTQKVNLEKEIIISGQKVSIGIKRSK
jgi:isoleucyl-tRNA synthetase